MSHSLSESALVSAQLGRVPREPWRIASRCSWGFPVAIVSPSRLADGTPFPSLAWLTCPYLAQEVAAEESSGQIAAWASRVAEDARLAQALHDADCAVRAARAAESGGHDACAEVGLGGQRDPLGVKCLHLHTALALVGIEDPIGGALLGKIELAHPESGWSCPDERCVRLTEDASAARDRAVTKED